MLRFLVAVDPKGGAALQGTDASGWQKNEVLNLWEREIEFWLGPRDAY